MSLPRYEVNLPPVTVVWFILKAMMAKESRAKLPWMDKKGLEYLKP